MFEQFADYMWYLLNAPFKKVKKSLNQWYIFFKVLGRRCDYVKETFLKARDETMLATCSDVMLVEYGKERGLSRYENEDIENFRKRVALYPESCRLGGTNRGIIVAVKSLGYTDVSVISAREVDGTDDAWAEFYVTISMEEAHPIGFDILCKEVRQKKEVGAKDNYMFITNELAKITAGGIMSVVTYTQLKED